MTTIGEVVSRLRSTFKAVTEDAFVTDRQLYYLALKYAKALVRRQDNENKIMMYDSIFETLPFVRLISVDKIEAECAGIKSECAIMRTEEKLPKIFEGSDGLLIRKIYSIDTSDKLVKITPTKFISLKNSVNYKYNTAKYYWYKNGHLYFPDVKWRAVSVEAMWEDSLDGEECTMMTDKVFGIPDYLYAEIEQNVQRELMTQMQVPTDMSDNNENVLR